jgi:hypothetical protein
LEGADMTDAQHMIGRLLPAGAQRDAIHIALAPMVAARQLLPGQHIDHGDTELELMGPLGIVDPFLTKPVEPGQRFWLFLYPNTVVGMRHQWEHPAFDPPSTSMSEHWIRDFAARIPLDYSVLMEGAADWVRSKARGRWGNYLVLGGLLEGESVPDEFWPHYERVTGTQVAEEHRGSFFSCSC